jgi:hypothetical protein
MRGFINGSTIGRRAGFVKNAFTRRPGIAIIRAP